MPTVPSAQVATHTHEDAHFVLLLDGVYVSSASGAPSLAGAPLLIYNPPGTTHRDRFHNLEGRFFTISVSPASLHHAAGFVPLLTESTALPEGHAVALAQRLHRECRQWETISQLVAEGMGLELLAETSRASERPHRRPPSWLKTVRELLHERCSDNIRISEIARLAGVHPIHLARTFREFFQCSPGEFLRRCRLDRAALLLGRGNLPISQVAADAGFADQSHFSKSFRKMYRISPREYRRSHVS